MDAAILQYLGQDALLASVARAIPARWQARVKSWLSR